jgi:hypothetical protein
MLVCRCSSTASLALEIAVDADVTSVRFSSRRNLHCAMAHKRSHAVELFESLSVIGDLLSFVYNNVDVVRLNVFY